MRGALKTSRWVEKAPCDLGGNNRVRIIEQAGWHVEIGTFEGAHASRNELLSCWPSTLVWLVSDLRAAFPSGPGDRRRQEAFGLGRAGIPAWDCSVEREAGTTVLMGQPGPAAHRALQSESHSPALQGQDHSQCLQVGQGWATCRQGYGGRRGPADHVGPGEAPWTRGPLETQLMLPVCVRSLGSCAARCFVRNVGGTL